MNSVVDCHFWWWADINDDESHWCLHYLRWYCALSLFLYCLVAIPLPVVFPICMVAYIFPPGELIKYCFVLSRAVRKLKNTESHSQNAHINYHVWDFSVWAMDSLKFWLILARKWCWLHYVFEIIISKLYFILQFVCKQVCRNTCSHTKKQFEQVFIGWKKKVLFHACNCLPVLRSRRTFMERNSS